MDSEKQRIPPSPLAMFGANAHYFVPQEVDSSIEKKQPTATVRPVPDFTDSEKGDHTEWTPGYLARFPWLGMGALFTVILCAIGSILTLVLSNGKSQTHWPEKLAPNVILGGLNNLANIMFGIAIGNGIAIAWWRKTLQGATIQELHRSWSFSSSFKDLMLAGKYFNIIALAALTTKLTIIDSMLLQRATTTIIATDNPVNVTDIAGFANDTIPVTGRVSSRSAVPSSIDLAFNLDLATYATSGGLFPNLFDGCEGSCLLHVPAAGFEFDCTAPTSRSINYQNTTQAALLAAQNLNSTQFAKSNISLDVPMFNITFGVEFRGGPSMGPYVDGIDYSFITLDILYTQSSGSDDTSCPGTLTARHCKLRPAVIDYPVTIQNYTGAHSMNGVSLGLNSSSFNDASAEEPADYDSTQKQEGGFQVIRYNDVYEDHTSIVGDDSLSETRLGGILLALQMYFASGSSISWGGPAGYYVTTTGFASTWMTSPPTGQYSCSYSFSDPIDYLVQQINQIMFSLGTDMSEMDPDNNLSQTQSYTALVYRDKIHYVTEFRFMWGAVASMIVCILCVLPTYWGYWTLGRKVTLGPFEIANAFRAPMLYHPEASNAPVDELLEVVGQRQVKYGKIVAGDAAGRLGVAEPEVVERVHPTAKVLPKVF